MLRFSISVSAVVDSPYKTRVLAIQDEWWTRYDSSVLLCNYDQSRNDYGRTDYVGLGSNTSTYTHALRHIDHLRSGLLSQVCYFRILGNPFLLQ